MGGDNVTEGVAAVVSWSGSSASDLMQMADSSFTSMRSYCSCVNNKCGGRGEDRPDWLCEMARGSGVAGRRGTDGVVDVRGIDGVDVRGIDGVDVCEVDGPGRADGRERSIAAKGGDEAMDRLCDARDKGSGVADGRGEADARGVDGDVVYDVHGVAPGPP